MNPQNIEGMKQYNENAYNEVEDRLLIASNSLANVIELIKYHKSRDLSERLSKIRTVIYESELLLSRIYTNEFELWRNGQGEKP